MIMKKTIMFVFVLLLLTLSSVYAGAKAEAIEKTTPEYAEPNNVEAEQSFHNFLNEVAGINLAEYDIVSFDVTIAPSIGSQKLETCISAIIENSQGTLSAEMVIIEGKVRFYSLSVITGELDGQQLNSSEILGVTQKVLFNYQKYFNASHCNELEKLIPAQIKSQNLTVNDDDKKLNIKILSDNLPTEFIHLEWQKSTNGLDIPMQSIQVTESRSGILTSFADSLGLYNVATLNTNISEQEAINIALPYITDYCDQNNRKIQNVNATLNYTTDFNGTIGDSFLIYPVYVVHAQLDDINTGIFGYYVTIWGDSGKVKSDGIEGIRQGTAINSTLVNPTIVLMTLLIIVSSATITGILYRSRKYNWKINFKVTGILLVAVLGLLLVEPVSAYPSTLLGVEYQDSEENALCQSIAGQTASWSIYDAGYTAYNNWGSGTYAQQIYQAAYDQGYGGSIVFYNGEGGVGDVILDNSGGYVWDSVIYSNSLPYSTGHHNFVMMYACHQGDNINGMPKAWLHTTSVSTNGFTSPDHSGKNYIGFDGSAPYLKNDYTFNNILQEDAGYRLLYCFYYYALVIDFQVNTALDYAVQLLWDENFQESEWYTGIPNMGHMVSYGDGNIKIGQGLRQLTVNCNTNYGTVDTPSGGWFYASPVYITATPNPGYQLNHWLVDGVPVAGEETRVQYMYGDHTVEPIFTPITYCWLTINTYDMGGGVVYANIYVDGDYVGTTDTSVQVQVTSGYHYISADSPAYEWPYGSALLLTGFGEGSQTINGDTTLELWYCPWY